MSKKKLISIFSLLILIDAITKYLVVSQLTQFDTIVIVPHFFNIVLVRNKGIAFGFLSGLGKLYKDISLVIIALLSFYFLITFLKEAKEKKTLLYLSVILIISGITGNIIDRLINGSVIDFIDIYFKKFHWPSFNFADIYITSGVFLIIFTIIKDWKRASA